MKQFGKSLSSEDVAEAALNDERNVLAELRVEQNLTRSVSSREGPAAFATAFYFVRYNFFKLNFLVGSRSSPDEVTWAGLVRNLWEELGGRSGTSHNQLYRQFLNEVGVRSESDLIEPPFAARFNSRWENHCVNAPFDDALAAIAIYEILDQPDYKLLLNIMRGAGLHKRALLFFEVHAKAEHFDLFSDTMAFLLRTREGQTSISRALSFVRSSQEQMWKGLLHHLQ
jgi:hypothetical protein